MDDNRAILIQLRYAKQKIERAKGLIEFGGEMSQTDFQGFIDSAISSLKTANSIIRGEGREQG